MPGGGSQRQVIADLWRRAGPGARQGYPGLAWISVVLLGWLVALRGIRGTLIEAGLGGRAAESRSAAAANAVGCFPLEFRSFAGLAVRGRVVSVLGAGSGVEDEGVVDAFFWGAGRGLEGRGEFGFGVALVAGQVDADAPAVG